MALCNAVEKRARESLLRTAINCNNVKGNILVIDEGIFAILTLLMWSFSLILVALETTEVNQLPNIASLQLLLAGLGRAWCNQELNPFGGII